MKRALTFVGDPCHFCNSTEPAIRYRSNGHCVECTRNQPQMTRERRRDYMRKRRAEAVAPVSLPQALPPVKKYDWDRTMRKGE